MKHVLLVMVLIGLSGCSSKNVTRGDLPETFEEKMYRQSGNFLGEGITIGGSRDKEKSGSVGIGVNSFLWQASLETISFMPLRSTDPFGGVILTEWYSSPEKQQERMKVDITILSKTLSPDSVRVKAFRQIRRGNEWVDAHVSSETERILEDTILTQARKLKVASLAQ